MTIKSKLFAVFFVTFLFAGLVTAGVFQIAKGASFHQMNVLHLLSVIELERLLFHDADKSSETLPSTKKLKSVIIQIRDQPIRCLATVNSFDEVAMRLIGTDGAIALCEDDIELSNTVLEELEKYELGENPGVNMPDLLRQASMKFYEHSEGFEVFINKTVGFTISAVTSFVLMLTGITLFAIVTLVRSISEIVITMEQTSKALEKSEEANRKLAQYDSLTGLPNRNLLKDRVTQIIAKSTRRKSKFAVMFIDLDRFKQVNDTQGHASGDELLIQVSRRLVSSLRESDTVSRIGGDEFVLILDSVEDQKPIKIIADKIIKAMEEPFIIHDVKSCLTVSIGISIFPDDGASEIELLKNADVAMYQAKASGKNCYEFYREELES